jgi:hypothetical protein
MHKPAPAVEQYSLTLKRTPKRAVTLLGLARALAMKNDTDGATKTYKELAAIWVDADADLLPVHEVRDYVAAHP